MIEITDDMDKASASDDAIEKVAEDSHLLALEERMMFDGAAAAEAADAAVDSTSEVSSEQSSTENKQLIDAVPAVSQPERNEIYFIDAGVENTGDLLAAVPSGAEIVHIEAGSDGVEQIAAALAGRTELDAIHILSHGSEGRLNLGNTTLTAETIQGEHADELALIASSLAADADILIYGCDFTAGEGGEQAAALLAAATGADVAASDDDTGHAALGGDWELETRIGTVEATALAAADWQGLLAAPNAIDDEFRVVPGTPTIIDPIENDNDPDGGQANSSVIVGIIDPANPTVTIPVTPGMLNSTITLASGTEITAQADGTLQVNAAIPGDSFDYQISSAGETDTATVMLLEPRKAINDTYMVQTNMLTNIDPVANDFDPAGNPLSITGIIDPQNGTETAVTPGVLNPAITLSSGTVITPQADGTLDVLVSGNVLATEVFLYRVSNGTTSDVGAVALDVDSDGDGVNNLGDIDDDNDGILDAVEGRTETLFTENLSGQNVPATSTSFIPKSGTFSGYSFATSPADASSTVTFTGVRQYQINGSTGSGNVLFFDDRSLGGLPNFGQVDLQLDDAVVSTSPGVEFVSTRLVVGDIDAPNSRFTLELYDTSGQKITDATDVDVARVNFLAGTSSTVSLVNDNGAGVFEYQLTSSDNNHSTSLAFTGTAGTNVARVVFTLLRSDRSDSMSFTLSRVLQQTAGIDSDNDGNADHIDIDKDDDGITDNIEAQRSDGFIAPTAPGAITDTNGDGLDDVYDNTTVAGAASGATGVGLVEVDTDGDGTRDTLDSNSDNDAFNDIAENGLGVVAVAPGDADSDNDGLKDAFETAIDGNVNDGFRVSEGETDPLNTAGGYLPDGDGDATAGNVQPLFRDLDYRDNNLPPVATNDSVTTLEDTPVSGNVISDNLGGGVDSDPDADPLQVTGFVVNGTNYAPGATANLTEGTLVIAASGAFTFTPAANYYGPVPQATYTITDNRSGSSSATLDITVTAVDDPIFISNLANAGVSDAGLPTGTLADGSDTVSDSFTISTADGVAQLDIGTGTLTEAQLNNSATSPVNINGADGVLTINGYNPATGEVSYTYTLTANADHTAGPVSNDFALQLTDDDGDTAAGTLSIVIADDAPIAVNDRDQAINRAGNPSSEATGNVITGVDNGAPPDPNALDGMADTLGADSPANPVTAVAAGTGAPVGGVGVGVVGAYGTLTLDSNGAYAYVPDYVNATVSALTPGASIDDVFTYQITDSDGSATTATLTIQVLGTPAVIDGAGTVFESDLPAGTTPAGTAEVLSSNFVVAVPEGFSPVVGAAMPGVTVAGNYLNEAALNNLATNPVSITTPLGNDLQLTGYNSTNGTIDYVYTLLAGEDHSAGPVVDTIPLTVEDRQGDSGSGNILITVINDAPLASDDVNSISADATVPVTGDVISNDAVGGDTTASPVRAVLAGTAAPGASGGVGTAVTGSYGNVLVNADGTYSYTVDNSNPALLALLAGQSLTDVFTYRVTDTDGDTTTAQLTITINGVNDPPQATDDAVITPLDTPVSGNVISDNLGNGLDSDPDADPLTVTGFVVNGTNYPPGTAANLAEGRLVINADGSFTFNPASGFTGAVPQAVYTISDGLGGSDSATLNISIAPNANFFTNTIDSANPDAGQLGPLPQRDRSSLIVDHLVGEVAGSENDLYSTPSLLSSVNTALGVSHPILTALHAMQALNEPVELPVASEQFFAGIAASGPIGKAVNDIGFEPLAEDFDSFNRDYPDISNRYSEEQLLRTSLVTVRGDVIDFIYANDNDSITILAKLRESAREPVAITSVTSQQNIDLQTQRMANGAMLLQLAALAEPTTVTMTLQDGMHYQVLLLPNEAAQINNPISLIHDHTKQTFTAQTERLLYANEREAALLMTSVNEKGVI